MIFLIIIPFDWGKWEKGREIINNPYFDCQTIDITTICIVELLPRLLEAIDFVREL